MLKAEIDIEKVDNFGSKSREGVLEYLQTGADKGFAVATDEAPVDRGELLRNMVQPTREEDRIIWGVRDVPYATAMEFGTGPFQPPVQPLVEWSRRVTGDEALGYYVALEKIPEEGVDEHPFMRPGRNAQVQWYNSHDVDNFVDDEL